MPPFLAKIIFIVGYWTANFAIRTPHIKTHRKTPVRSNRDTSWDKACLITVAICGFIVPLFYVFTPLLAFADYRIPTLIGLAGVVILALGDWIFWKAHRDLAENWSPTLQIRENHRLITFGIYGRIRHPMYLSIWLLVIAQAMILPNYVAGFSGLLPFATLYFTRIANEERMMADQFGADYEQYRKVTGRIFPRW